MQGRCVEGNTTPGKRAENCSPPPQLCCKPCESSLSCVNDYTKAPNIWMISNAAWTQIWTKRPFLPLPFSLPSPSPKPPAAQSRLRHTRLDTAVPRVQSNARRHTSGRMQDFFQGTAKGQQRLQDAAHGTRPLNRLPRESSSSSSTDKKSFNLQHHKSRKLQQRQG